MKDTNFILNSKNYSGIQRKKHEPKEKFIYFCENVPDHIIKIIFYVNILIQVQGVGGELKLIFQEEKNTYS